MLITLNLHPPSPHPLLYIGSYNKDLSKMTYLQNRRYLPLSSKLREDEKQFPEKIKEVRPPPQRRDYETIKSLHISYDAMKTRLAN